MSMLQTLEPESMPEPKAVLLLAGRGRPLLAQRQRLYEHAQQLGLAIIGEQVFRRRRRGGLGEQLRAALPVGVTVVVIERMAALTKDPLTALLAAAEIRSMGFALVSAEESWLLEVGALLPALGGWLQAARKDQRREVARAALSRARAGGRKTGRPRKGTRTCARFSGSSKQSGWRGPRLSSPVRNNSATGALGAAVTSTSPVVLVRTTRTPRSPAMKKPPSRREIEAALTGAFVETLQALGAADSGQETALATVKALLNIAFGVAEAADIERQQLALKIRKVAERRLPRLKNGAPAWTMPVAKA